MSTKIEWADEVWNVVTGCTHSGMPGCDNCYARRLFPRVYGRELAEDELAGLPGAEPLRPRRFSDIRTHPDRLDKPLHWRKPRRVFACSMGDLFHEDVPNRFIAAVFGVMAACPQHTFQVLTKRPERMRDWFEWIEAQGKHPLCSGTGRTPPGVCAYQAHEVLDDDHHDEARFAYWPLPNVWLGTSASTPADLERVVDELRGTPAAVRFLSLEPLLAGIDLDPPTLAGLNWVIVGAESGPKRRPCKLEWVRSIVEQCRTAGVPVFHKQMNIDGRVSKDMDEWPEDLRVCEMPK